MKLQRSRASLPSGYLGPEGELELLPWSYVDERMQTARHYWLSTVDTRGDPHTRPVAGMWLDQRLYFGGSPQSKWARNLTSNPRACFHLSEPETGDQAIALHGDVVVTRSDRDLAVRLVAISNEKYGYGQTLEQYEGESILEFEPEIVIAWTELGNATRWEVGR